MSLSSRSAIVIAFLLVTPVVCKLLNAQVVAPRDTTFQVPSDPRTYADSLRMCNGTSAEIVVCFTARLNRAESELRTVSRRLVQELRAAERNDSWEPGSRAVVESQAVNAFRLSQRRWRALRDAECDWRYGWRLGSMYIEIRIACKEELTRARIRELQAYRRKLRQESR